MSLRKRPLTGTIGVLALASLLAACGGTQASDQTEADNAESETPDEEVDDDHDDDSHDEDHDHGDTEGATEVSAPAPRIALTYDGGLLVVDANTGEVAADLELDGFNRINAAGDGRHILVSTEGGWAALDAGTWSVGHGDHDHYYTATPELHDVVVTGEMPAHVVNHDGLTALFDDGTGTITVVESEQWTDAVEAGQIDPTRTYQTDDPHHGVAIADSDGRMLVTDGDEESRSSAAILDGDDTELDRSDQCPGVHGETVANGDLFIVGCEDGVLILHDDHFHKLDSPDEFGRIGNAFGVEDSPLVLGDYRADPDGGIELSDIALIDAEAETIETVNTGTTYTWQGLDRGADGEALVLGSDGQLHVFDPATGDLQQSIDVVDEWDVPENWQEAHPNLEELAGMAYISDPATNTLHAVDYVGGEVWQSWELPQAPIEIASATG